MDCPLFLLYFSRIVIADWDRLALTVHSHNRVRCEPGWRLDWTDPASLQDFDLWFVWAGRGRMRLTEGTELDLRPGVCLWMRPGRTYVARHDPADPLGVTYIHFDLRRDGRRLATAEIPGETHEVEDFAFADAATRRVVELLRPEEKAAADGAQDSRRFEAESLLASVLASLDRRAAETRARPLPPAAAENRRRVARAVSRITENPGQVPPIAELARSAGYSSAHFVRVFREAMGETPQAFIIKTRLGRAQRILTDSSLPVGEVAAMLGYADAYFFSRQFKAKVGCSPSEFRAANGRQSGFRGA